MTYRHKVKMIRKEHYPEWMALIFSTSLLMLLYGFNILELIKRLLEWTFAVIGFKLLIDYGLLQRFNLKSNETH